MAGCLDGMVGLGLLGGVAHTFWAGGRACGRVGAGARPGAATAVYWWEQASGGYGGGLGARLAGFSVSFVFPLVSPFVCFRVHGSAARKVFFGLVQVSQDAPCSFVPCCVIAH